MKEIIINNVKFTNIPDKRLGVQLSNIITQTNVSDDLEEYLASENFYKLISAIDIDWNGVEVAENVIINNTGELINWINSLPVKGANGKSAYELYKETVNESNAIYSFTSWSLDGNIAYGEGTVEVIEQRLGGATVKVLTNTDFGSNPTDFVGMEFDVQQPLNDGDLIQLYIGDEPQQIAVRATLQTPAVVAMTQEEWLSSLKGETGEQGPKGDKGDTGTFDASDLENYATKEYVSQEIEKIVGAAPENFDTLKEISDVMGDLKIVDTPAVPAVEGEHYTQEEIDAAQEGDEAYGKTVNDWKIEPVEAVEEVSHNMTIKEFVENSMESVNEKPQVSKIQTKYDALLSLLNITNTQVNNVVVNNQLQEANNDTSNTKPIVTYDEPVNEVTIPETTKVYTVEAPLEDNSVVTLSSNKYMTLNNTSEEPVNTTIQRPAEQGETGTTGTTVYLVGDYDTLTLENISPNAKSGEDPAKVNNVVITEDNTKNLTLTLDIQNGGTITNNSNTNVTITDKNNESTVLTVVAPNSTVTLNGSNYETLTATVSDNTLIIKKTAHIGTLNVTKGNVKVEVPRESDIASVIDNINIADGYSVDYLHDEITSANISKLNTTGTHVLQEDIAKSGNFSVGMFSNDDIIWDLNGHNITSSNTRGYGIFTLRGSAKLEINDTVGTGVVKNTANEYGFWTSTVGSKVIINGGNFEAATHVLYAQKGTIEVNGGSFKLTDAATADKDQNGNFKFLLNCHDADYVSGDANIIVRGGKFYGYNPAETYGEPGGPVSFVAEGYESVLDHVDNETGLNVYIVRKTTSEESTENQTVNGEVTSENGTDTQIYNG